jgi:hypothetical protein
MLISAPGCIHPFLVVLGLLFAERLEQTLHAWVRLPLLGHRLRPRRYHIPELVKLGHSLALRPSNTEPDDVSGLRCPATLWDHSVTNQDMTAVDVSFGQRSQFGHRDHDLGLFGGLKASGHGNALSF